MQIHIELTHPAYSTIVIPPEVAAILLDEDDFPREGIKHCHPGTWYITYNSLTYYDKDGAEHVILGTTPEVQAKRPEKALWMKPDNKMTSHQFARADMELCNKITLAPTAAERVSFEKQRMKLIRDYNSQV